ncbi:MAG TPA: valine--tRNA ligase [Deltaproteobacteria bacterium]|nr:MAG: valine--tRNA ligase [Deltaproteobacteria bacterium GWA2_45_12]HBF12640.1 valine--tRNA ligase [Deltaproteobacteria bacterium]
METKELDKIYEPHTVEDRWIEFWLQNNLFAPDFSKSPKGTFSIVIPPPNVTGSLHMGHALNSTLQDILVRYHRMNGENVLWVVGTDHAGIATQNVVEKQLHAEGKNRHDLGREKFVERVWKWKTESGGTIISQLKRLGASCDYKNERFTMDEGLSTAVKKVFVQLYKEGLIYRGERLINWCPRCHTALSDLEVEHSESQGSLWHIKYPIVRAPLGAPSITGATSSAPTLIVATTRPETLLGDTAVAVNSNDERYKDWIGKKVKLPLTNREIPVIADDYVDKEFGSGVVKITPAHDFNDFLVGNRHGLEHINILTIDGKINDKGGAYAGLTTAQARQKVVEDLEAQELLEKIEPYKNKIGHCYRCRTVVEPFLSFQWFVSTKPLAEKAIAAVKNGESRFVPQHWEKTYFNWMENIQDWCISRQIWWGHQIPAWYCEKGGRGDPCDRPGQIQDSPLHNCPPIVSETPPKKCSTCGSTQLTQDPDVLDTWFSSALWPFSTLGWPWNGEHPPEAGRQGSPLQQFYPTSVLVTAFDIIFFWVARMMMMGIHFMGKVPFKDIHIHALVRDPTGAKMSKSKGNVVDPLVMMHKYGTDAFRFTLAAFAAQGRDIKLDEARIEGYRNFCNKIWNASRFALMNAAPFISGENDFKTVEPKEDLNRWILVELSRTIRKVSEKIKAYEFNQAAQALYQFFWMKFCDSYVELSKEIFRGENIAAKKETAATIYFVLDTSFKLLHPFMPFITEEIWQILVDRKGKSIALASFPVAWDLKKEDKKAWEKIELLNATLSSIRSIRQETGLPLAQEISIEIKTTETNLAKYEEIVGMIMKLGKLGKVGTRTGNMTESAALVGIENGYIAIPLAANGIDRAKETERVQKKLGRVLADIKQLELRLNDPKFMENAEADLITEKRLTLTQAKELEKVLKTEIDLLNK